MRIDENDAGYLTPEYVMSILPTRYARILQKALKWHNPTTEYILMTPEQQCVGVVNGLKPIVYGFKESTMQRRSQQFGLEYMHDCLFLPENADLADLVGYAISRFEIRSPIRHFVIGIACGYPLEEVIKFSKQYVTPNEEMSRGLSKHDDGNTVR